MRIIGSDCDGTLTAGGVGDNINDLDMLNAFYSYAVASGVEEAKQAANHVTKGITELIETELSISIP